MFRELKCIFIVWYAPLDDKNIAYNKIWEMQQWGFVQEYTSWFDNIIVALPNLAMDNTIYTCIYSFKPCLKGFVKAQA